MDFGICCNVELSPVVRAAGWAFVEENVQGLLKAQAPESEWNGPARVAAAALPVRAMNSLVPGSLPIVGDKVDEAGLTNYMNTVLARADALAIRTIVFGSGGARRVPDGFDRDVARGQILRFVRNAMSAAARHKVTVVLEPLQRGETNIINTVAEAMTYVREVNHPNFQCLVDSYHFWLEDEPLENLSTAMPWIKHVHVADKEGRVWPGLSGKSDYRPFFNVIKAAGYKGLVSVEGKSPDDVAATAPNVLKFLQTEWAAA